MRAVANRRPPSGNSTLNIFDASSLLSLDAGQPTRLLLKTSPFVGRHAILGKPYGWQTTRLDTRLNQGK
jgi:hypothetical protein